MNGSNDSSPDRLGNPLRQLTLEQLRRRTSAKWRHHPEDVLPLWVAEMDVPLAEPVAKAVIDAIALGDTGYPSGNDHAEALSGFAAERWGWRDLPIDRIRTVPDVMVGLVEALALITDRGDEVVVNCPVHAPFYRFISIAERRVVEAPLSVDDRMDLAVLEAAFARPQTTAFLLCHPHNPTGTVHTAAELTAVAELAEANGVRVVADEVHAPLVAPGTAFVPFLTVPRSERGLSLMSASKAWNLAGLKAAAIVAGPGAAADLQRMPQEVSNRAGHVGVMAHTAALREGGPWLDALVAGIEDNRRLLAGLLADRLPTLGYRPQPGTYLAWLDCRSLGLGDDPAAAFLERGRVALNSGVPLGTGGAGHVRLNFATHPDIVTEAVERMARTLETSD